VVHRLYDKESETMTEEHKYETATAHRILDDSGIEKPPKRAVVKKAAVQFCQAFKRLIEEYGWNVKDVLSEGAFKCQIASDPHFVSTSPVWLVVSEDGDVVSLKGFTHAPVPLRYNRRSGLFEGKEDHAAVAPMPGGVTPRSAALEVMASGFLKLKPQDR
jgi:hypothetical protein